MLTFSKIRGSSLKNVGAISRTNDIPYIQHLLSHKGAKLQKECQNGMKFYHSLEILTNKLQNKFQLDMWKENEIISRNPEQTDGWTKRRQVIDITVP
jgi:hypothetical protein